jgi:hypothetical protein
MPLTVSLHPRRHHWHLGSRWHSAGGPNRATSPASGPPGGLRAHIVCGNRANSALTAHDHDSGMEDGARAAPGHPAAGTPVHADTTVTAGSPATPKLIGIELLLHQHRSIFAPDCPRGRHSRYARQGHRTAGNSLPSPSWPERIQRPLMSLRVLQQPGWSIGTTPPSNSKCIASHAVTS